MLKLPSVTLFCADCLDTERAIVVLEKCKSLCEFGAVKLLTSLPTDYPHKVEIDPLLSLNAYSIFMLKRAHLYVETDHVLVVQHDGWILNPEAWNPDWLKYDYIGPLFIQKHDIDRYSVGTGGFSFRSKALMEFVDKRVPAWDGSAADTVRVQALLNCYEDGVISRQQRDSLEQAGFKFPSPKEAAQFAQGGNNDPAYHVERPFGFHGLWPNVNRETGIVAPPPFWE